MTTRTNKKTSTADEQKSIEDELMAMSNLVSALAGLDNEAKLRVLNWATQRYDFGDGVW